jgi:hypothetical protein
MVSTPYTPDGLFDIIEKELEVLLLSWNISHITASHRERTEVVTAI